MSKRLDQARQKELEPKRIKFAKDKLESLGYKITVETSEKIEFIRTTNKNVVLFPYSGWWSGKGIGSGRGITNLIKALGHGEEN